MNNFTEKQMVTCVEPLEGYLTKHKTYIINKLLPEAGRVAVIDDNGKECHAKVTRFEDANDHAKQIYNDLTFSFDLYIPPYEALGGKLNLDLTIDNNAWIILGGQPVTVRLQRKSV